MQPPWSTGTPVGPTPSDAWAPPPPTVPGGPPGDGWPPGAPPRTNSLAVVSLVTGLGQMFIPFIGAIVAIVTGHVARHQIRRAEGREQGAGMALGGLILGYDGVALMVLGVIAVIVVVAVFQDDWAQHTARADARDFAERIEVVSAQRNTSPRDADVLLRAWVQACDCGAGGTAHDSLTARLPNGVDIFDATDDDWARGGWRVEVRVSPFGSASVCMTVPSDIGAPASIVDGACTLTV